MENEKLVHLPFKVVMEEMITILLSKLIGLSLRLSFVFSLRMIPEDSVVPPLKPADIGGIKADPHAHAEHAMNPSPTGRFKSLFFIFLYLIT